MARKPKSASVQREGSADSNEGEAKPNAGAREKTMTKTAAVKAAIKAGVAGPKAGTAYIFKEFGIAIRPQHFSAVKSQINNQGKPGQGRPGRPKGSASGPVEGYLAPPRPPLPKGGDLIDALEQIKPLIAQYGADRVKRIVDLIG